MLYSSKPSNEEILQWVQLVRSGDECAFENLFKHFYAQLCEFAFQYVKNRQCAEDIVQLLFLHIYEKGEEWNPTGNIKSYLFTAVRNRSLNYLRSQSKTNDHQSLDNPSSDALKLSHTHVEEELYAQDLNRAIQSAFENMPDQRRRIFMLSRESNLTYREIAKVLGISIKTVETQMGRALKLLRKELNIFFTLIKN
jgi:RNA polymerase sigma-70 factor (ECF subfamily)